MQLSTQVIKRNAGQFSNCQKLLVFGPPENDDLGFLNAKKMVTFDYRVYLSYQSHQTSKDERIEFACQQQKSVVYDAALVFIPKSRGELNLVLALVTSMLQSGADLFLVGEKKAGIASAAKRLNKLGLNNSKIDSAKHCQLWHVSVQHTAKPFVLKDWFDSYRVELNDLPLTLATLPGVFSFGRLDAGTELLLSNMLTRLKGRVLDFGCGNGVIGAYAKLLNPDIQLEMVDVNCLALECAKQTCSLNGIEADIYPSNGWSDVLGRVDALVTNPPFHAGVQTEYQTTESFIRLAKDKLSKHAPFLLVANRFLKYAGFIDATFERHNVLVENTKYKVYQAFR